MSTTKVTDNLRDTTQVDAAKITTGTIPEARITSLDATKLTGTVADARFPSTLPASSGANLTALPAGNLTGSIADARVPASAVTQHVTPFDSSTLEYNQALLAFKIASSNQLAKFQMVDQVIDEYQDATGIDAGNSTNEIVGGSGTSKYYEGRTSGGSSTTVVKSYTGANQTFTVPSGLSTLTFKAWGAGGGSGGDGNANGGGGGFVQEDISVTAGETLNVKVGGGGQRIADGASRKGGGGGWTSIDRSGTFLAGAGGGGGAGDSTTTPGGAGGGTTGSAGGGPAAGGGGPQSAGGAAGTGGTAGSAGTGGRAKTGSAVDATGGYNGGGDGDGDNTSWTAGGGGGGYYGGGGAGNGGGGGGSGYAPTGTNTSASGNTVANGSDSDYQSSTGNGGTPTSNGEHGAAVLIYTATVTSDLTLQSTATTAESAPTSADLVVLIEDASGTATVNTDIKGYISRDGSAFSSAVTFVDEGDWGTNKRILVARNVDISGIASGTSMKYKLTTHNQSGAKETRIHATSLAWGG